MRSTGILCCVIAMLLFSCNNNPKNTGAYSPVVTKTKPEPVYIDSLMDTGLCMPCDSVYDLDIIIPEELHHGGELPQNSETKNWFGLFKSGNRYYVDSTKIKVITCYDPIVDPEDSSELTGTFVHALHKDTSILLISDTGLPLNYATENLVKQQRFPFPGEDTIIYKSNGVIYRLYATAITGFTQHFSDTSYVNYKLYLQANKNGIITTQVLFASPMRQYESIGFIGDIDGDGVPDMLLYLDLEDASVPTLYLSRPATKSAILKAVALSNYTGC